MSAEEYKPGFKAWIFSVFLAAGFGNLLTEGVQKFVSYISASGPELELRDKQCDTRADGKFKCDYYIENVGDSKTFITKVNVGTVPHERFLTSHAVVAVESEEAESSIQQAHLALVNSGEVVMIGIILSESADLPGNICFFNIQAKQLCV